MRTFILSIGVVLFCQNLKAESLCEVYFKPARQSFFSKVTAPAKEVYFKFARELDKKVTKTEPWQFDAATEARLQAVLDLPEYQYSIEQKLRFYFDELVQARFKQLSPIRQFFVRAAIRDVFTQKSFYRMILGGLLFQNVGPHYNPIFNRVVLPKGKAQDPLTMPLVAFHETEHLLDRNSNYTGTLAFLKIYVTEMLMILKTPLTPHLIRRAESRSIGAQWEFVSRMSDTQRQELIKVLETPISGGDPLPRELMSQVRVQIQNKRLSKFLELLARVQQISPKDRKISRIAAGMLMNSLEQTHEFSKDMENALKSNFISRSEFAVLKNILKQGIQSPVFQKDESPLDIKNIPEQYQSKIQATITNVIMFMRICYAKERKNHPPIYAYIFLNSLKNAKLSKQEFIEAMSEHHGYTLNQLHSRHYGPSLLRKFLILQTAGTLFTAYMANTWDLLTPDAFAANDFRFLAMIFQYFMGY